MTLTIPGLHHVTAIAGNAQANIDFYTRVLGLRLVKRTVNFDDPGTYHFYFGDSTGTPGSVLTFFPFQDAGHGRAGTGMASAIAFATPPTAFDYWMGRFADEGRDFEGPENRFGEDLIALTDPDGLRIELIATANARNSSPWDAGPVSPDKAIAHMHSVTLCEQTSTGTADLLTRVMGYERQSEAGDRMRLGAPTSNVGNLIDLRCQPDRLRGAMGAGSIHHVAFRATSDDEQLAWIERLQQEGLNPTTVLDRQYFRSIYFREPGGVLFEIATDAPGFLIDESHEALGEALKLPSWLEPRRERIEQMVPPIVLPEFAK